MLRGLDQTLDAVDARRSDHDWAALWQGLPERRVCVVGHAGTTGVILSHLLGWPHVPWPFRTLPGHASLSRAVTMPVHDQHAWSLQAFSDTAHLPATLRTM